MRQIEFLHNSKFSPNDIGTSNLFVEMFEDEALFCPETGWLVWNGKFWEHDTTQGGKINEMVKQMALYCITQVSQDPTISGEDAVRLNKYYSKLLTKNYRDTILRDAMSIRPVRADMFDKHKYLFNCQNGTYDFKRHIFRDHERTDYLTDISNVTYDKMATCPRFEQYLNEVMENDQTKIDYLLKIAAYCMTGDTSRECFFVFYGDKTRNGKGTFVSTLTTLLGTYAQTIKPASITKKTFNSGGSGASPDLAKLSHTRLANVNEIEDGMMLDIALMKELTGGDTITARFLYKEEFNFVPQFKILINTNVLPKMSEDSIFRSDRIHLLNFDRHFEEAERDLHLKDKLKTELSGIFNLIAPYYDKLETEGFIMPQSTKDTIEQYQLQSNNVLLFTREQLYENKTAWETLNDIYQKYTEWCAENGYSQMAKKTFKDRLARCGAKIISEGVTRKTNSKGLSLTSRDWVQGYSIEKRQELTQIEESGDLPF